MTGQRGQPRVGPWDAIPLLSITYGEILGMQVPHAFPPLLGDGQGRYRVHIIGNSGKYLRLISYRHNTQSHGFILFIFPFRRFREGKCVLPPL